jgi:hypothetical protein
VKNGQKPKLGDAHAPQEISKRYNRQSLGMPPRHPFFIGKNQVTFQDTIFLLLHAGANLEKIGNGVGYYKAMHID